MTAAKKTTATVIPGLRYEDAPAAIEWLCRAFGFEKSLVVPNPDGSIAHAQLRFGNGMVMLGSAGKHGDAYALARAFVALGCYGPMAPNVAQPRAERRASASTRCQSPREVVDRQHRAPSSASND